MNAGNHGYAHKYGRCRSFASLSLGSKCFDDGRASSNEGVGLPTNRISSGSKFEGCGRMAVESDFIFAMSLKLLLFGVRGSMRTLKPGRTQVIFWPLENGNTLVSRTRYSVWLSHARLDLTSNFRAISSSRCRNGVTKMWSKFTC